MPRSARCFNTILFYTILYNILYYHGPTERHYKSQNAPHSRHQSDALPAMQFPESSTAPPHLLISQPVTPAPSYLCYLNIFFYCNSLIVGLVCTLFYIWPNNVTRTRTNKMDWFPAAEGCRYLEPHLGAPGPFDGDPMTCWNFLSQCSLVQAFSSSYWVSQGSIHTSFLSFPDELLCGL